VAIKTEVAEMVLFWVWSW